MSSSILSLKKHPQHGFNSDKAKQKQKQNKTDWNTVKVKGCVISFHFGWQTMHSELQSNSQIRSFKKKFSLKLFISLSISLSLTLCFVDKIYSPPITKMFAQKK